LNHYKHDSLKYRAAKFLIENMPGKYGIEAENPDDAYKRFLANIPQKDSINWKLDSCHVGHLLDSVSMVAVPRMRKVEDIKAEMLEEMTEQGVSRWETPFVQIVRREGSRSERFDAKRFKEEHADMYSEYVTESVTKASITIKIKGE
jgi:hypothetical protein